MNEAFQRIMAVTHITFMDGVRKHALIGLIILALGLELSGILFMDFFGRDVGRASSDFLLSIIWLTGMVFIYFHAIQSMAWSENQKVVFMILSRPISRSEYVLGSFLGLLGLLSLLQLFLGFVAWGALTWIQTQLDVQYFPTLNIAYFLLSVGGIMLMQMCVLAVVVLFCGVLRGSFLVLMMSIAYYAISSGIPVVLESLKQQVLHSGQDSLLLPVLTYAGLFFPDFARLDFKDYVVMLDPPHISMNIMLDFGLGFLYVVIVLMLANRLYARRDL